MSVDLQTMEAKSNFVRKERKVREEKQSIFVSSRSSRTDVFASVFVWRRNKSNNGPQMNANERECFAFHLRSSRFSRTDVFAFAVLTGVAA